ncbi:MAG: hypothetical protein S4CHLAM45_04710 [Chlamydiales bacterium]|nr:hypothetical protein [Chlamydiales bacterium]MCH9622585.1 hypothetical protein [Chlamydiales bacterium]
MQAINSHKNPLISCRKSLPNLALLVTGVALTVLGGLQLGHLLNLGCVSGWALTGPGLGFLSILAVDFIATYIKTEKKPVEPELEVLWKKNKASHIPIEEFRELVTFLQAHSPEMRTAIEKGSLLDQVLLKLTHKNLTKLPNSLGHLINLTQLNVSHNQLTVLPDAIGQLTKLTQLNVENNKLAALPDAIEQLTNLTKIYASYNQLAALPDAIGRLTNLTYLNVSENQLTVLPDAIGQLTNLTQLYMYKNQLAALPDAIGRLTNLTELDASHNQLTALPNAIGQLTSLAELYVYENQLAALPDAIGQLTSLTKFYVRNNQLATLPSSIGDLSLLGTLQINWNRDLSILPMSLGNCSQLTHLSTEGTNIPQSNHDQILLSCLNIRDLESVEKLPHKIKLWRGFGGVVREWTDPEFTREQKGHLYEWLLRLEKASDFNRNQKELAEKTCAILETVHTDVEFRNIFFNLIAGDLTACGDRAAMSLNLVYTDWRLYTLPAEASLSEKVQLLVGCGRALKLRQAVLGRYRGYENVEKVLYAEVNLRERLDLVTAITSMIYSEIGHVQDSVIEEMAQEIEAISDAELVIEFGCWENYLKKHHASEFSKIKSGIEKARKTLLTSLENDEIKEGEHQSRDQDLQAQEQEAILQLTQKIIDGIHQSEVVAQS